MHMLIYEGGQKIKKNKPKKKNVQDFYLVYIVP